MRSSKTNPVSVVLVERGLEELHFKWFAHPVRGKMAEILNFENSVVISGKTV